ncbi:type 2 isopentenyl-diphosphate Delta-isomerase [Cytobacillus solani]|uniref:Isopentenyl-diphosphate delta-isomerase n=1 Tax=Cytobacillus solani TaxID=1637975 RepID=A0A0Q3VIN2_9BACI|nr:type 2 isopentenyl-diphosphate Delta-isomerase [Cytobacillus solani]KOP83260.1 isopentenyl pyrophosphate isomerase [Bacillus sp. FJAT-21945]KQL20287.1 isopentenyl pyrophosphate isomerase [Cytobacillus solani]USK53542.1 type 2 isopentenyl-diphosphate Delta-isomerase [Cytobacillus solani]
MSRSKRKWDHIRLALATGQERNAGFEDITFIHQSLPNTSLEQVKLDTKIGELSVSSPIFINAMTGGGGTRTLEINRDLAFAAKELGMAISVGSQMSALKDPAESESYRVIRTTYPDGIVIGNLGSEATIDQAKTAVDMIEANALQIHLNVVQELTMPEGDRNFCSALTRIEDIVKSLNVPIIVKEVGFGMNKEAVSRLLSIGVSAVDVGGYGGTNFAKIENNRRENAFSFFNDWGISTTVSIAEAKAAGKELSVLGSGGVQNSLDIAKAIALGADAVGVAGYFLKILMKEGVDALIEELHLIHGEITMMMTALGVRTIKELQLVPIIISGKTHHWLNERNIDTKQYSQR